MSDVRTVYDRECLEYDSLYLQQDLHRIEDKLVSILLRSEIDHSTSVLDIGSGTGSVIDYGLIPSQNYFGVDISKGMTDQARCKYPDYEFLVCDASIMEPNQRFDVITFIYGQLNYMGVDAVAKIIKNHGSQNVKFLAISYGLDADDPDAFDYCYSAEYQNKFTPRQIIEGLQDQGISARVHGFSWPKERHELGFQFHKTMHSDEDDLMASSPKYYITSNFEILK